MSKFLSLMTLAATGALMLCSPVSATTASETAGEGKVFTAEAMHKLYRIGGIQLSPDGKHFIYTRSMAQLEQNDFYSEIMVGETGKPGSGRAILGKNAGHSPVFLDDQTIAFVSTKGDKAQIALCNLDGSNLRVVSDYDFDVIDFLYSPDRKKVVVIREVMLPEISKEENPDLGKQTGHIYDDLMYKHWDEWNVSVPQSFIATVSTDGNVSKELRSILHEGELFELPTKPFGGTEQLSWTKDSKQIAYSCRKKVGKEYAVSTNTDIYLFDLQSGKTTNLTEGMMGYDTNPTFSPDGTKLAWLSMEHDGCESDLPRIFVMDMKSGKKTFVSKDYEYYPQQLGWCSCGKKLRFVTPDHGTSNLFNINIETGKAEQMTKYDLADVTGFAGEGKEMLLTIQSMAEPTSAFAYDVAKGEATKLTPDNDAFLADYPNVTVQRHIVKTTDGKDMITWFILPPNFDPNKKYPTVLFCEGGPQSPVTQFWSYRWNFRTFASAGFIMVAPNRRGTIGNGKEWTEQISGDYGGQNIKDYLSAIDYAATLPYVDKDRLGATGASYGGFSVYYLAGHHEGRFKAFAAHAGMFNLDAQYLETEELWFTNWDLGGPFWETDKERVRNSYSFSPHHFVDKWDTPILCIAGGYDFRILYSQGMQAFNAAQLRGIPSRMLYFPDESHWILKPQNSVLFYRTWIDWMNKWLNKK